MLKRYLIPILALLGALFGVYTVYVSQLTFPTPSILFLPPSSPYPHAIAGSGIIQASSKNISIGSPFNEIIAQVYVIEGDHVKKGDPLIRLDTRTFESQLAVAEAQLELSLVSFLDKEVQFSFYKRLKDARAVSEQVYQEAYYAMLETKEQVKVARANVDVSRVNIERSTIRAPIEGEILQLNAHVGETAPVIAPTSSQSVWETAIEGSLLLMGAVQPLQVKIDIDEDDAWRYERGSPATAFLRGNSLIHFPLQFVRVEPYVVPKSSFTGQTTERVDTRVLQVLYNFEKGHLPVYPGLVLDIFIDSKPIESYFKK